MPECLIVFASLNQVHRLKRRLSEGGRYVDMVRTPKCLGVAGCSFALRCEAALLPQVRQASEALSISIRGVFVDGAQVPPP